LARGRDGDARPESRQRRRRAPERRSLAGSGGSGIKPIWTAFAATADKEGWPAARFLGALAEQEMVERSWRRFERHLGEARLPPAKTLDAVDFNAAPIISKVQVQALAAGDAWIEKGWRVLFTGTTDLVQKLQIARRDLVLEAGIAKLDKYHLAIRDGHRLSEQRASMATSRRRRAGETRSKSLEIGR
jgi:DNA replication protein DnaC